MRLCARQMYETNAAVSYCVLYKRLGETQWNIRRGWIHTDDAESLRHYFSTLPTCEEFYVVSSEPRNNTLQMFGEIRSDFKNQENHDAASSKQLEEGKAVTEQLLRHNKTRVKQEDQAEAERREQLRQIATTVALYSTLT
jgi:hypothetical protein